MASYTIPEEIIGVPLFVPDTYDFFSIESAGLPNGDDCLVVHGDVDASYLAFQAAPTFAIDVLHHGEVGLTLPNNGWSMTMWLKCPAASPAGGVMVGCMNINSTLLDTDSLDGNKAFAVYARTGASMGFVRSPLNNVASPDSSKTNHSNFTFPTSLWTLLTINIDKAASVTDSIYLNKNASATASDTAANSGGGGSYTANQYLCIGGYGTAQTGRAEEWRIGKWAFHDHPLNLTERSILYDTMAP
jgi:hypothetical protein